MKTAVLQLTSSDSPEENRETILGLIDASVKGGAGFVCTPEVSNCVSMDRAHQVKVLRDQDEDQTLLAVRRAAKAHEIWISLGSLALKGGADGRFVNRSFLIGPDGEIAGTYDKIHMFDVQVSEDEIYAESSGYAPGGRAVVVDAGFAKIGMTICYDVRFPHLHRTLAKHGAEVLLIPSAFSPVTGVAHWEPLLRARAIETGCYVIASAQSGQHRASSGKQRETYGHSMVISPWGEVLANAGTTRDITFVDLDVAQVSNARKRIPALTHDREFTSP